MSLDHKIDFIATIEVKNANPNGDPLAGNYPRTDIGGYGIITDVCLKRKLRNRMQDQGQEIFVKANDRIDDGYLSLQSRYEAAFEDKDERKKMPNEEMAKGFCENWVDVRSFGQVVTYDGKSIGIRGPVSIAMAKSLSPVEVVSMQITRSTNAAEKGNDRASDTMGSKQYVDYGVYVIKGSINPYFAEKTQFSEEDADLVKECLRTLFVNDASAARPEGSMEVVDIYWFDHPSKIGVVSSGKVFNLLQYDEVPTLDIHSYDDYGIHLDEDKLKEYQEAGLKVEHFHGL
ncbi:MULTISPECIES: type I-C CRISPR-associated protein Cas7/Csd2 [Aerococcus]|uniref:type I-C CRISPR-associated protein Cas7/Csd2 n=1 Tax=Aerococcus TaxID=1375 RepID=UPI0018A7435E|nr:MULTISPECIES: type I-C CRISPR-associated protein Cas7/Csd2 [Aerococcus]MCY3036056.1 type I-C CRISPR-associated protein Cas7/Csd2 [Aerococcus sp. Group 2]MCY3039151.1 type I-C CRISPR-associated protein Cas7/Csd2 [Aerococcus sp. Group 2]MCY3040727.1 type I-C CRISPR-associated protein Cas7/Csd2 [Aerococcus sp. Group 2]MCY3042719.1 type I-C CRISPR-associated protein Cas7/Csd2 [Aerococcus sp. Group 2]MDK6520864.1 type I-C CRISPR-associated protein Cas7/Csd2 [Aerococcus urinae]